MEATETLEVNRPLAQGHVVSQPARSQIIFAPASSASAESFVGPAILADADLKREAGWKTYRTPLHFDCNHTYFFEHKRQHLPGLLLIEAARQASRRVAQAELVEVAQEAVHLRTMEVRFKSLATLDDPVVFSAWVAKSPPTETGSPTTKVDAQLMQCGRLVMDLGCTWALGERQATGEEVKPASPGTPGLSVDRIAVHKSHDHNVFVDGMMRLEPDGSGKEAFAARMVTHPEHSYFFRDRQSFVPDLYLIEAGRQMGLAVSHLMLGADTDKAFVLDFLEMQFPGTVATNGPVSIYGQVEEAEYRKGVLQNVTLRGHLAQHGRQTTRIAGRWMVMSKKMLERLEKRCAV